MNRVIRKFSCIGCAILGVAATGLIISSSTSALTEESEVDVKFTFNPMLTLSVSSADIIIPNLIPGTSDNSNTVAVTVNTNNISGYTLSATVGNTTNSSRNLVHTALNTNLFSSIDTSSNITSFTTDNTWGYSIDDGAHYSGLPIYTDTPKEIKKTTEAGNSYTNFLIGAKASSTQISGDYTNVINFTVVTNAPPTPAIQELSPDLCTTDSPTTVIDIRDNTEYKVQRLADGNCWMLDNLRLDLTDSNVTGSINVSNTDVANNEALQSYLNSLSHTNWTWDDSSTTEPMVAISGACPEVFCPNESIEWSMNSIATFYGNGSGKIGAYYNLPAVKMLDEYGVSKGTICPKGWTIPDMYDYQALAGFYNATASDSGSVQYNLSIPLSGEFPLGPRSYGYYWTSSAKDYNNEYFLAVTGSAFQTGGYAYRTFDAGCSLRCFVGN